MCKATDVWRSFATLCLKWIQIPFFTKRTRVLSPISSRLLSVLIFSMFPVWYDVTPIVPPFFVDRLCFELSKYWIAFVGMNGDIASHRLRTFSMWVVMRD